MLHSAGSSTYSRDDDDDDEYGTDEDADPFADRWGGDDRSFQERALESLRPRGKSYKEAPKWTGANVDVDLPLFARAGAGMPARLHPKQRMILRRFREGRLFDDFMASGFIDMGRFGVVRFACPPGTPECSMVAKGGWIGDSDDDLKEAIIQWLAWKGGYAVRPYAVYRHSVDVADGDIVTYTFLFMDHIPAGSTGLAVGEPLDRELKALDIVHNDLHVHNRARTPGGKMLALDFGKAYMKSDVGKRNVGAIMGELFDNVEIYGDESLYLLTDEL